MTEAWDVELGQALLHSGFRARTVINIATIPFTGIRRAVYRVDLESGETIKARRLEDESIARRLVEHRRGLPDAFVPVLARHGRVVLEGWVHGRILEAALPDATRVAEAAALLAALHSTPVADARHARDDDTSAWREKTDAGLQTLAAEGALSAAEANRLRSNLERLDPRRSATGLAHFDFCGENMIVDDSDQLRVIDNERVGIGAFGFDLARTWYRWKLSEDDWRLFALVYAAARDAPFPDLDFWRVVVLVHSAALRLTTTWPLLAVPLERLRRLVEAPTGAALVR